MSREKHVYTVGKLLSELEWLIARASDNNWTLNAIIEELGFIYKRALNDKRG